MSKIYNILVTGSKGQLGSEFHELSHSSNHVFFFVDIDDLDITNEQKLEKFLKENSINVLINCATYTAVDKAEDDKELCELINRNCLLPMTKICNDLNIHLIHYSTDYVFNGSSETPYKEDDSKSPISQYGKSKSEGEDIILENSQSFTLIRTAWVYSSFGNNFVKTMLRLGSEREEVGVVADQWGAPTYAYDLAKMTLDNLAHFVDKKEIYHFSNEGKITWAQFASKIFELSGENCHVKELTTEEYPTKARRPQYSLLDKTKIRTNLKYKIPDWDDALKRCLMKLKL